MMSDLSHSHVTLAAPALIGSGSLLFSTTTNNCFLGADPGGSGCVEGTHVPEGWRSPQMKCFFASNLLESVITVDSDNRPGVQMVRDNFCLAGLPNDWESDRNNINGWPAPWGGRFEWCWKYHPSFQGGTLSFSPVFNSEEPHAIAIVLPGIKSGREMEIRRRKGLLAVPADRPLILYHSPIFQVSLRGAITDGQHRNSIGRVQKLGEEITAFLSDMAIAFSLAFLTRNKTPACSK